MKVGYIRVSTKNQNTARQEELMKTLEVDKMFIDIVSGKDADRLELKKMLEFVREGDIVIVESISRFARNTKDLLELVERLSKKNVEFISQKEKIDTATAQGRFLLTIFGAVAELERNNILERQAEGIAIAKQQGKYQGRKPKELPDFEEVYKAWKRTEITGVKASEQLSVSRSTFYRKVREYEKKSESMKANCGMQDKEDLGG